MIFRSSDVILCPQLIQFCLQHKKQEASALQCTKVKSQNSFQKLSIKYLDYNLQIRDFMEAVSVGKHHDIFFCFLVNATWSRIMILTKCKTHNHWLYTCF